MERRNEYLERKAVDHLHIKPDDVVLEVGFGHGKGLQYAAKQSKYMYEIYNIFIISLAPGYVHAKLYQVNSEMSINVNKPKVCCNGRTVIYL